LEASRRKPMRAAEDAAPGAFTAVGLAVKSGQLWPCESLARA
jgi:hypothetical protein